MGNTREDPVEERVEGILTKELEMFVDLPLLGTVVEAAAVMASYRLPRPNPTTLEIGRNWIYVNSGSVTASLKWQRTT